MYENLNLPLIFILLFHAIVYTQSGVDKILNWKGNFDFTKETLTNKFPVNIVKLALFSVLILEFTGGIFSSIGVFYAFNNPEFLLFSVIGLVLCSTALLILLFGQRISQNYIDAKTITIYFIVSIIGLVIL
jgi:uncharacterized membrane protein YphA (DoxX/SURF4 family)